MRKWLFGFVLVLAFLTAAGAASAGPLIVIDPGHSGGTLLSIDPQWNMYDYEYDNGTENHEVWNVSVKLKTKLVAAGYAVMLTKTGPDDVVSKRDRINLANNNGAALFVTIHRDAHPFGTWGHVYVQRVNDWRASVDGTKKYFTLADVAAKSSAIGNAILSARRAVEGPSITMAVENFTGRGGYIPAGNLAILQLWATVPALLMEAGICDTDAKQEKYALGVFNGIRAAIPTDGSWRDISNQAWLTIYGVSAAQVRLVADGYADGSFRPSNPVNRGQFAKMSVDGLDISLSTPPAAPTFVDVPVGQTFFGWIETGVDRGLIEGVDEDHYRPAAPMLRQQVNTILGRYLEEMALKGPGYIEGDLDTYDTVAEWYAGEGAAALAPFSDSDQIATVHKPYTAYLTYLGIVKGSNGGLSPSSSITRAQSAVLIVRVSQL
jgi:N-acetylmuramoyl-L-alanine amidase